jgi:serine/threonine protein kinase
MICNQPLSNDQLIRHLEGPTQEEIEQVNQHIEDCLECEARLAVLAGSPRPERLLDDVLAPTPPVRQPPTLTVEAGKVVGHYQRLGEIARGGMGVVCRCYDHVLHRELAMKFLKEKYLKDANFSDFCRQFQREARVLGELQHPGIVPIHDSGTLLDGRPFFVMKLVKGRTLAQLLEEQGPGAARWLGVFAAVCQAVAYAHSVGVIHRDLKPGNVMVGAFDEVQVMDLGLAKVLPWSSILRSGPRAGCPTPSEWPEDATQTYVILDECDDHTVPGSVMGTWEFMPPEQARGLACEADERSDVFGLGAFLCAILTGKPPYVGDTKEEVKRQARKADLAGAYARLETCGADADLIKLAKRCLAVEPDDRPQNAGKVATAVTRYLGDVENRKITAEKKLAAVQATAAAQRRAWWLTVGLAACAGLLLLATGVASFFKWQFSEAEVEGLKAKQDQLAAEVAREAEKRQNAIDRALTAAMSGDLDAAEEAITEAERDGASTGQIQMLRGQIALHRGQSGEAIRHLEEAVRLLPESVAARGMLAAAYASDGHWERCYRTIREMMQLTPSTPEDFLFKGYAEANLDPARGLRMIKQAFDRRPMMGIALLLRAEVRADVAQDTDDLAEADGAVQDARYARELLRDNPAALWVSLNAHLAKAGVHEHRAEPERRRAELDLAGKYADALKPFTEVPTLLPEAIVYRWLYFREVGREEEVLEELRRASERTDHVYVAFCYALTLYRRGQRGDFEEALRVLEKKGKYNDRLLPFVLAEHDYHPAKRDWQARARKASEDFAAWAQDGSAVKYTQAVLCLLGEKGDAVEASKALLKRPERLHTLRREPVLRCLRYNAGDLPEDDLIQGAEGSRWDQCLAHYYVAMMKLAEGDRDGAREHFAKVVETRAFIWGPYDLSWVFLARLAKDPTWPKWIPEGPAK